MTPPPELRGEAVVITARFIARTLTIKDAEAIRDMVEENERLRAMLAARPGAGGKKEGVG